MRIVDSAQMAALDRRTIDELGLPGAVLMERAALGVVQATIARRRRPGHALVLVGPGNNGGDGSAIARMLADYGWNATIALAADRDRLAGDAAANFAIAERRGVPVVAVDEADFDQALERADVVVDALLGIGLESPPRGAIGLALQRVLDRGVADKFVVAVDIATGVAADTGATPGLVLPANLTVTFAHRKWGHVLPPGTEAAGEVHVVDIGIPGPYAESLPIWYGIDQARGELPTRPKAGHKGTYGHVLVLAGSPRTPGAAVLAGTAALRAGAGLVTVAGPSEVASAVVGHRPELMTCDRQTALGGLDRFSSIVLGPGLGLDADAMRVLAGVVESFDGPVVADADALTLLGSGPATALPGWILTPHPAELGRLLGVATPDVLAGLPAAARAAADRFGCTIVAKTAGAIVVDGGETAFVAPGSPGMATAGAGDVLSGVIGAMACVAAPPAAARLGVWLHAAAGRAAERHRGAPSVIAGDIIEGLGHAFDELLP